ncbi:hypothetical protein L218DRAFT_232168 [Marasmius fiardii PR-910]|nr:hypothetical protein L218DRAFT_232168 [Marasmius fiardii PR-910]
MASVQADIDFNGRLCDYWHLVALTLILLDHLYTLDVEIKFIWSRPTKLSGRIFFLHRYFNLFAIMLSVMSKLVQDFPLSCRAMVFFREAMLIFAQLVVVFILTLRMYALYGRGRRLLCFMLVAIGVLLSIACVYLSIGFNLGSHSYPPSQAFTFTGHNTQPEMRGSCHTELDKETSDRQAIAWMTLFTYDTLIFGLGIYNAFKTRRELQILRHRVSLKVILLRDGSMYFGVVSVVNLANILTFYLAEGCMRGGLAPFASSLSVTLVSRLMLNLHEVMDVGIYMGLVGVV